MLSVNPLVKLLLLTPLKSVKSRPFLSPSLQVPVSALKVFSLLVWSSAWSTAQHRLLPNRKPDRFRTPITPEVFYLLLQQVQSSRRFYRLCFCKLRLIWRSRCPYVIITDCVFNSGLLSTNVEMQGKWAVVMAIPIWQSLVVLQTRSRLGRRSSWMEPTPSSTLLKQTRCRLMEGTSNIGMSKCAYAVFLYSKPYLFNTSRLLHSFSALM